MVGEDTRKLIAEIDRAPILADGAMGTEIFARGVGFERPLEELNRSRPGLIADIHRRYAAAGAALLTTNTFGANRFRLAEHGLDCEVAALNRAGVRLARDAAAQAGRDLWIVGSVGPIGVRLAPLGRAQADEARAAFVEQIAALAEEGVDLLALETFSDLGELREALHAARDAAPGVPVCALVTFTEDGSTPLGEAADRVAATLVDLGADLIGANCSVGPARLLPVVATLVARAGDVPVAVKPNAGWPQRVGARLIYPATPDYFAEYAARFLEAGARLVGGCCGTTPAHVSAMRRALERHTGSRAHGRAPRRGDDQVRSVGEQPAVPSSLPPTALQEKLRRGRFVTAVELDPPRGHNPGRLLEAARELGSAGVDVLNVADVPTARLRMSAWALAHLIQREAGIESVLHFPTRGRNLLRLQADLLAAHALGVRNLVVLMGDPPSIGDFPQAADPNDLVPTGLVRIIKQDFNAGRDPSGGSIGGPTGFHVGAALNLCAADLERELRLTRKKVARGVDFFLTQPVFDGGPVRLFLAAYRERYGELARPVIAGVLPVASRRNAEFLHNEVPGIVVPPSVLARMRGTSDERREGVRIAQLAVEQIRELVQGIYVMPMLGRYDSAAEIVDFARRP